MKKHLLAIFCTSSLLALPSGGEVVRGHAAISDSPSLLKVEANGKAIIHWNNFDIASHETVSFSQSQSKEPILNQITGGSATQILGSLQANCPIYLINPDGVYVGNTAKIETAGFLASTAHISADQFFSNEPLALKDLGKGSIVNLGTITSTHGDVFLIARSIDNQGQITASRGVIQGFTNEVIINPSTKQTVFIRLGTGETETIQNSGELKALSIELKTQSPYEKAINHSGTIEAVATHEHDGHIYLVADEGGCQISGSLATAGGPIRASAKNLVMTETALVDASVHESSGSGGDISLTASTALTFHGMAKAHGGYEAGDGGTIHLSCQGDFFDLSEQIGIDVSAPYGKVGHLIFDPKFVIIYSSGQAPATGNTFASNPAGSVMISGATLQSALNSANVTIQANTDIVFADNVTASSVGNGLTLQAGRSISLSGNLTLNQGDFTATINDNGAASANRDAGIATFQLDQFSTIQTQGGNLSVNVGTFGGTQAGEIALQSRILDAGGGNISIEGFARRDGSEYVYGISGGNNCLVQTTGSGSISLTGTGGTGSDMNTGIYLTSPNFQIQTDAGTIHMVGFGGGDGTGDGNWGVYSAATCQTLTTGSILVEGTAGTGVNSNMGVCLAGGGATTQSGNITLTGTGAGTGDLNFGVRLDSNAQCISNGTGILTLTGISGNGQNDNHGVNLSNATLSANTGSISITGTGQGLANSNYGIRFEASSQCISTGTAPISLQGNNLTGQAMNAGISISTQGQAITSGYGDVLLQGTSGGTSDLNQGILVERGTISSTGTGAGSAQIHLIGTGGPGTDHCNGTVVIGAASVVTSVDGNIIIEGTAGGVGTGNQPIFVNPPTQVYTTGSGTVTYIPH